MITNIDRNFKSDHFQYWVFIYGQEILTYHLVKEPGVSRRMLPGGRIPFWTTIQLPRASDSKSPDNGSISPPELGFISQVFLGLKLSGMWVQFCLMRANIVSFLAWDFTIHYSVALEAGAIWRFQSCACNFSKITTETQQIRSRVPERVS